MFNEEEFFNQIFDKFVKISGDPDKAELFRDRFIIDLMDTMKKDHDTHFVQNALLVLMALFEDHLKDSFYTKSENAKELTENDKIELIDDLREALAL